MSHMPSTFLADPDAAAHVVNFIKSRVPTGTEFCVLLVHPDDTTRVTAVTSNRERMVMAAAQWVANILRGDR